MTPPVPSPLRQRHAVITGGGRGIGLAIAHALSAAGAAVTLIGRTEATLAAAAAELGPDARHAVADIRDEPALRMALAGAEARQPIDILVNNAGGVRSQPLKTLGTADFRDLLEWNLVPVFTASQQVLPGMRARGWGRIVNIASTAGLKGYAYVTHYCAAKHGVVGLTRAMAVELARTGVTVNAVCPGYTDTDLLRDAVAGISAKTGLPETAALDRLVADNPQGRPVTPAEVADAVLWLCGAGAGAVTGQALSVSGGEVMS